MLELLATCMVRGSRMSDDFGQAPERRWAGTRAPRQALLGTHAARALLSGPEGSLAPAGGPLEL